MVIRMMRRIDIRNIAFHHFILYSDNERNLIITTPPTLIESNFFNTRKVKGKSRIYTINFDQVIMLIQWIWTFIVCILKTGVITTNISHMGWIADKWQLWSKMVGLHAITSSIFHISNPRLNLLRVSNIWLRPYVASPYFFGNFCQADA